VDLKGQLSNPHPKLETLAPQGSRPDQRRTKRPSDPPEATSSDPDEARREAKGRLSNPTSPGPRRQIQRRLKPDEIDQLLIAYLAGDLVADIAARFGVSRTTVLGHVGRRGLPRRRDGWTNQQLRAAADLYAQGASLVAVGHRFGVDASTVRNRFRRTEVHLQPRRA
jgi:transposase